MHEREPQPPWLHRTTTSAAATRPIQVSTLAPRVKHRRTRPAQYCILLALMSNNSVGPWHSKLSHGRRLKGDVARLESCAIGLRFIYSHLQGNPFASRH